jgi:hypothetical protein
MKITKEEAFGFKGSNFNITEWDNKKFLHVCRLTLVWEGNNPTLEQVGEFMKKNSPIELDYFMKKELSNILAFDETQLENARICRLHKIIEHIEGSDNLRFGADDWSVNKVNMLEFFPDMKATQENRFVTQYTIQEDNGNIVECTDTKTFKEILLNKIKSFL